jgi:hypothetical protein
MPASVKFDLWYFNTPEMDALIEHEGAIAAQGAMLQLFRYLRLCHNAIGNRRSLSKIARDSNCSEEWLWHIVTSYGLFIVEDDESFFSPYLSGLLHATSKSSSSRMGKHARKRAHAPYNEDNHHKETNDDKKENKEKGGKVSDMIGPSAYEMVDRAGLRHGHRGELVPWWASPQTDIRCVWSLCGNCWTTPDSINSKAERQQRQQMTDQDFMMKTAWEILGEDEQCSIQDHGRRI